MSQKHSKKIYFWLVFVVAAVIITIFNIATPLMSDDLDYMSKARTANNLFDIFRQEYTHYMTWNGRSVTFTLYRIFLCAPEIVLKLANSAVFMVLSMLIYANIQGRKKYDAFVLLLVQLGLWVFGVSFAQTILWECGAFVYLWGLTIILGFLTTVRHLVVSEKKIPAYAYVLIFLFGWAAGWCNENTSGGALLLLMIMAWMYKLFTKRRFQQSSFLQW